MKKILFIFAEKQQTGMEYKTANFPANIFNNNVNNNNLFRDGKAESVSKS